MILKSIVHIKKGGGWSGLKCAHERTLTGNNSPGFCEAKKVPFLAQVLSLERKCNEDTCCNSMLQ